MLCEEYASHAMHNMTRSSIKLILLGTIQAEKVDPHKSHISKHLGSMIPSTDRPPQLICPRNILAISILSMEKVVCYIFQIVCLPNIMFTFQSKNAKDIHFFVTHSHGGSNEPRGAGRDGNPQKHYRHTLFRDSQADPTDL